MNVLFAFSETLRPGLSYLGQNDPLKNDPGQPRAHQLCSTGAVFLALQRQLAHQLQNKGSKGIPDPSFIIIFHNDQRPRNLLGYPGIRHIIWLVISHYIPIFLVPMIVLFYLLGGLLKKTCFSHNKDGNLPKMPKMSF